MKRFCYLLFTFLCTLSLDAQRPAAPPELSIFIADSLWTMTPATTISELRPGWEIQGFVVGRKLRRYLWGKQARQNSYSACPAFVIRPAADAQLTDYALIRLQSKKQYRRFSSATLAECEYRRAEPHHFQITPYGDDAFRVQPHENLKAGEYVWVCLTQKPANDFGDVTVYDFSVR